MQTQRSTLSPLAIVTPMPHRRSSLLSMNSAASPRTPRSCPSPSLYYPANRKSTDSWNSSNADDMDVEWKQEHVLLLSRTLDALPAHLVTPFNGPIPPSNLLDKIARGVSQAKGPQDWPYSIRATRAKLLELARTRAREEALDEQRRHDSIAEEIEIDDGSSYSYFHDGEDNPIRSVGIGPRRPLYRQSSMDFIKPCPTDIKDNPNIARLSNRLQRSDRVFPNPSYHPYSRIPRPQQGNRRSSSPPHPTDVPALINPSTPSSSTLNSLSSISSAPRGLRRSSSTVSSSSLFSANSVDMPLADPRIQRLKRSDSLCSDVPPAPPPKDFPASRIGFKRAPSYGTLAQEVRQQAVVTDRLHERKLSGSYPSSDEEEKARTRHAKKLKTKTGPVQSVKASAQKSSSGSEPSSPTTPQANPVKSSNPLVSSGRGDSRPIGLLESPAIQHKMPVRKPEANGHKSKKSGSAILELGLGLLMDKKGESKVGAVVPKSRSSVKIDDRSKTGKSGGGKDKTHRSREGSKDIDADMEKPNKTVDQAPKRPLPMNLQRNPSMFGAELPPLKSRNNNENKTAFGSMLSNNSGLGVAAPIPMLSPAPLLTSAPSTEARATKRSVSQSSPPTSPVNMHRSITSPVSKSIFELTSPPSPTPTQLNSPGLSPPPSPCSVSSPTNHQLRTLRRVRRLPPNAPGRRISFGSLRSPDHAPGDEADMEGDGEAESMLLSSPMTSKRSRGLGLGSAFQLH